MAPLNSNIAPFRSTAYPTVTTVAGALDAALADLGAHTSGGEAAHNATSIYIDTVEELGVLAGATNVETAILALGAAIDAL